MPKHSAKQNARLLSAALIQAGISDIVISPGSRNAPLIIELTNRQALTNYSIVDERVAGFFALGLSQQSQKPSVLVCTSGSALLNYYPAIAEAFYSHIPLIVISADRPQKWIDQGEGQTIRQHNVFKNHSWYNVTLSETGEATDKEQLKKAIETAIEKRGPIHINIPFDEPLYDKVEVPDETIPKIQTDFPDKIYEVPFLETFEQKWQQAGRKMILVGQHQPSEFLSLQLKKLAEDPSVIILTENISNVYDDRFINHIDQVIFPLDASELQDLKPDILVTIGRNIVSKKVKQFLRQFKPTEHWHIEKTDLPPNTFEALTQHFNTSPEMFLSQFLFLVKPLQEGDYSAKWHNLKQSHFQKHLAFLTQAPYSDLKVFDTITKDIPDDFMVQWGNSSTIRYAQFFEYPETITHFANRGTSGIDGSGSTAFGAAVQSGKSTLLVSGDISFLYDSNALWHKYIPDNFKIIVINNGGGDIFNFIPGPSNTAAIDDFFVTKHHLHTQHLAEMYRLKYHKVSNLEDLQQILPGFFADNSQAQLLEIDTQSVDNAQVLKAYFKALK